MLIKHVNDIAAAEVTTEGAAKAQVRIIFGPKDGAPNFAMRQFELAGGGYTPFHQHPFEHEILVLQGKLALVSDDGDIALAAGDAVLIMPGERHRLKNLSGADPAIFLCMIPGEYQK